MPWERGVASPATSTPWGSVMLPKQNSTSAAFFKQEENLLPLYSTFFIYRSRAILQDSLRGPSWTPLNTTLNKYLQAPKSNTGEGFCLTLRFLAVLFSQYLQHSPLHSSDTYFCFIYSFYRLKKCSRILVRISVFLFLYESSLSTWTGNLLLISFLPFVKNTDADCLGSKNKSILSSNAFLHSSCFSNNAMLQSRQFLLQQPNSKLHFAKKTRHTINKASHIYF